MTTSLADRARAAIRNVADFPKPGILFRDITTLLLDSPLVAECVEALWMPYQGKVDRIAGIESRGFILGATMAVQHSLPFVPLRKPGKLPAETLREAYALEYGTDALEVHKDALPAGSRVLIVDDLLATGGTARAAARLVERAGGEVAGFAFLIELDDLHGRRQLDQLPIEVILHYEGE